MPCNLIAAIAIVIEMAQLEQLRQDADAMNALKLKLEELLGVIASVSVGGDETWRYIQIFVPDSSRYVQIDQNGLNLYGRFDSTQRDAIQAFIQQLLMALTENNLVNAIAEQLPMLSDEPVLDEWQNIIGRQLVVRV